MLEKSEIRKRLDKAGFETDSFPRLVPEIRAFAAKHNIPDNDKFYDFTASVKSLVTPELSKHKICSRIENNPKILFDLYIPAAEAVPVANPAPVAQSKPEIKSKKGAKYIRVPTCHQLFNILAEYISEKGKVPNERRTPEVKTSHGRIKFGKLNKIFAEGLVKIPEALQATTPIKMNSIAHFMLATGLVHRTYSDKEKRVRFKVAQPLPPNPFSA